MLTPAAKRRRAEAASATLARPFRSPAVRGPKIAENGKAEKGKADKEDKEEIQGTEPGTTPRITDTRVTPEAASPERKHKRPRQPGLSSQQHEPGEAKLSLSSLVDQFNVELDVGDKTLEDVQHLRDRAADAKLEQTKDDKVASTGNEDELPALIGRWREAGRLAAEEVFGLVSERVAQAGGVKAWRAMTTPEGQGWGDGFSEDAEERNDRNEDGDEGEDDEAKDDGPNEFTMAMMLAGLHVDVDLLGYDELEERWRD